MKLPAGPFDILLADPAWRFLTRSAKGRDRCPDGARKGVPDHWLATGGPGPDHPDSTSSRAAQRRNQAERHYATMSLDEIKAMPVGDVAAKDAVLFLWVVDPLLKQGIEVGEAWGFTFKTVGFYWAKLRKLGREKLRDSRAAALDEERRTFPMGTGYWTRANPEQCLLFTRGRPERISAGVAKLIAMDDPPCRYCDDSGWFYGDQSLGQCGCGIEPGQHLIVSPRREHSRKPDEQYERIEQLCGDKRRLELFARTQRPGWSVWGNETDKFGDSGSPDAAPAGEQDRADASGRSDSNARPEGSGTEITKQVNSQLSSRSVEELLG